MAVDALPWFPLYAKDFLTDEKVLAMSNEQVGLYIKLLCLQWIEGSIPADWRAVSAQNILEPIADPLDLKSLLRASFPVIGAGRRRRANPRLEAVRAEQTLIHQRLSARGHKGSDARWASKQAMLKQSESNATPECLSNARAMASESDQSLKIFSESDLKTKISSVSKKKPQISLTDDEWLVTLRDSPAYVCLSVDTELAKMDAWLSTHPQKQKTRRFIVNWLNSQVDKMRPVDTRPTPKDPGMSAAQRKMEAKEAELRRVEAEKEAAK